MNNEDPADPSVHEPRQAPMPCPFCGHVGLAFGDGSTFRWLAYCGCASKWLDYEVRPDELAPFFESLPENEA